MRFAAGAAMAILLLPVAFSQVPPVPPNPVVPLADQVLGSVVVPVVGAAYNATGQNITREDVRLRLDMNLTKGDVGVLGLLLGSGNIEVQANIHAHAELRVISVDRVRSLVEDNTRLNVTGGNATFLEKVYLPAEVFRASLSAEALAAFQREEENMLANLLQRTVPDLTILGLRLVWSHTSPGEVLGDTSLTEPPITVDLYLVVQYLRVESIPSLFAEYTGSSHAAGNDTKARYLSELKDNHTAPRSARDFLAAAAYDQLLNLTMRPGWSLDVNMSLPRGYEFTYFNQGVDQRSRHDVHFRLDASRSNADVQDVLVASITQPRAVIAGLFAAMWVVGLIVALPARGAYAWLRLNRAPRARTKDDPKDKPKP
jgi:hypothetical protein